MQDYDAAARRTSVGISLSPQRLLITAVAFRAVTPLTSVSATARVMARCWSAGCSGCLKFLRPAVAAGAWAGRVAAKHRYAAYRPMISAAENDRQKASKSVFQTLDFTSTSAFSCWLRAV
jgi:hypothetical protein